MLVLALGALDFGLEQSIVVPAIPVLAEHYNASFVAVGRPVTGFLLAGIVAVPFSVCPGDLFASADCSSLRSGPSAPGHSCPLWPIQSGSSSLACLLQGLGMAVGPLTFALARDLVAPDRLPRAIGAVVGAASAGVTIGLLLSGLLVDHVSVTAIFWFLFVLAVALIVATVLFVPESPVIAKVPVDFVGAGLLSVGMAALLLAISQGNRWGWTSMWVLALFSCPVHARAHRVRTR